MLRFFTRGICPDPGLSINNKGNSELSNAALRVAGTLQSAALQSGNLSMMTGIRNNLDENSKAESLAWVLKILEYVEEADRYLSLVSPGTGTSRTVEDEVMTEPMNYAKSMAMLARDIDAEPVGAFAVHAPSVYLLFLQQLAIDLMA